MPSCSLIRLAGRSVFFEAKLEAGLRSQLITTLTIMSSLLVVLAGLAFAAARLT